MLNRLWPALHRVEFAALNVLRAVAEALVNDDLHPVLSVRPTVPLARLRRRLLKSSPSAPTGLPGSNSAGGIVAAARRADAQVRVIRRA